jgi:hypothetical protein
MLLEAEQKAARDAQHAARKSDKKMNASEGLIMLALSLPASGER